MLTVLVAVSVSGLAAVIAYPHIRNDALRRSLGSEDDAVRRGAMLKVRALMRADASVRPYLERVLNGSDDRTFLAIVSVLSDEQVWDLSTRPAEQADRYRAIMVEQSPVVVARRGHAWGLLTAGRVNEHVRRAARATAVDNDVAVRAVGAALAAKVGDEASLRVLMMDVEAEVVAAAMLDAGLTGRTALADDIAAAMELQLKRRGARTNMEKAGKAIAAYKAQQEGQSAQTSPADTSVDTPTVAAARSIGLDDDLEVISNAALALARLAPREYSERLAEMLSETDDPWLQSRLLYVMPRLDRTVAERAVAAALRVEAGGLPLPAAIVAGATLGLRTETEQAVRDVLAAVSSGGASVERLRAACHAAVALDLDVGEEIDDLLWDLWDSQDVPLRSSVVQLLAAHARRLPATGPETGPDDPQTVTRAECIALLKFLIAQAPFEMDDNAAAVPAAVAAWELLAMNYPSARDDVKDAATLSPLAAFELAWRMARDETPGARDKHFELALSMLPDPRQSDEEDHWIFEPNVKVAGAMWMGLSLPGGNPDRVALARQRIILRLNTVRNPYLKQTYEAALLALGQRNLAEAVRTAFVNETRWIEANLLYGDDGRLPQFLPIYAALLIQSGDRHPLDWLLANDRISLAMQTFVLQNLGMSHVVRLDASLPTVDPSASGDLLLWQVNILRHAYLLRGEGVSPSRLAGILPTTGRGIDALSSVGHSHGTHNAGETPSSRERP